LTSLQNGVKLESFYLFIFSGGHFENFLGFHCVLKMFRVFPIIFLSRTLFFYTLSLCFVAILCVYVFFKKLVHCVCISFLKLHSFVFCSNIVMLCVFSHCILCILMVCIFALCCVHRHHISYFNFECFSGLLLILNGMLHCFQFMF